MPRRRIVREMVHRAKEENPNSSWKILQLQLDPDRDGSRGIITGEEGNSIALHKQSCKRELFGQGQIYLTSPPAYRLFQCQGAPNLLESLLRCRFPGLDAWVRLRRHLSDAPETYSLPIWISMMIYFYFVFIEDQSFKTHVQSMWNSNTPVISIKLLYNPSQFLDQGFMLCFDQIRPSANINGEVSLLFDYLQFLLFFSF